jgi:general secretion pathway protein H
MWPPAPSRARHQGFTMIELLVVIALIAMAATVVSLSLPDPAASRLEREGARLVALLESARTESRVSGVTVTWKPATLPKDPNDAEQVDFRFLGLPRSSQMPTRWLGPDVVADIAGAKGLVLGPEPLIGPQRVILRLEAQQLTLQTDGLAAFAVVPNEATAP